MRFQFRSALDGRLSGIHASPQPGVSVEFAEHKEYAPGDDLRHLDWKAFARTDKFNIRQFARETHTEVFLVVDQSASMDFSADGRTSKRLFAARLAASLAWVLLHQNDSVGLLAPLPKGGLEVVPARSHPSHYLVLQDALSRHLAQGADKVGHCEGDAPLNHAFEYLVSRKVRRSAIIVLSDLLMPSSLLFPYLSHLRLGGNSCWLIHLLDPAEWDFAQEGAGRAFPFDGSVLFRSPESGHGLMLDARASKGAYIRRFGAWLRETRRNAQEISVDYSTTNTDTDAVEFIYRFLQER